MTKDIQKWLNEPPNEQDIKTAIEGEKVYKFIPIEKLRPMLDEVNASTKNFHTQLYKNGYAELAVSASIELEISYRTITGDLIIRTASGACNFALASIGVNPHWNATAKAECIKNAAKELAVKFGRDLNLGMEETVPEQRGQVVVKQALKFKPDSKIMKQFMEAVAKGDEATITMLSNMYEIKGEGDYAS